MAVSATAVLAVGAAACGGSESSLSEVAQRGRTTALNNGCASCHGSDGQGGVGPSWVDLAGSERVIETDDGTATVVADDAYLLRSIREPAAEVVEGFNVLMPVNGLTEAQALDVVAYIKELASEPEN